ncbi:MAG TPA: glycosyltransferase family 39 protein [Puia sp.]|nr:glycosyltransferase family 39 protein [Puia sp.]
MIDTISSPREAWLDKWFVRLLIPAILINASGLFIPIIEPDGALYATISRTMAGTGDLIRLHVEGKDWLDKPHFPFWMAALSMRIFGINSFAYKLPALLFWAAGGWYVYRLGRDLYGRAAGQLSVLIYVSAAHLVISNNDVRAEPYLTGLVIGAVYHFYRASRGGMGWHLVAGSLLASCAMMTKGPFVLVTIGGGFIVDWIIRKEWRQFLSLRWWIALLLIGIFIIPEIYCLYVQFDCHPEKKIFGRTGVSGVKFFFWDSQFGRFLNTGPIKGSGDPFFYFHTLLWAFLPWSLLLYAAVFRGGRGMARRMDFEKMGRGLAGRGSALCWGAAVLSFIMFSLSRFQLPYYLNILFPFFSILTAGYLLDIRRGGAIRAVTIVQGVIAVLLPLLAFVLCWFCHFPGWVYWLIALVILAGAGFYFFRGGTVATAVGRSCWAAMVVYLFVNCWLYPSLLQYQAGMQAAEYLRREKTQPVVYLPENGPVNYSIEFYAPGAVRRIGLDSLAGVLEGGPVLFFMPARFSDTLRQKGYSVRTVKTFPNFHISQLTGEFINYRTREKSLEWLELAWIGN